MLSNWRINGSYESSESTKINYGVKRRRYEVEDVAGCEKLKGVVPQQNGHWGAQIYANHQRIWLGTFKSERDAAMAYDSATIKLRSRESHRNFAWNNQTVQEPMFQSQYSMETIMIMIRNGTYPSNFATTFLRNNERRQGAGKEGVVIGVKDEEQFSCTQLLFQKELTPSDVGKLNRLVVPKKHAVTYFPLVCGNDVEVVFYDKLMRLWKFRYCYWKSSQSYVFTRGWNRFVKDKKLKAKDTIVFYRCEPINLTNNNGERLPLSLIDVIYSDIDGNNKKIHSFEDAKHGGLRLFGVSIS
ncbi:putative transcription factor RAV family [Medicago truncatula]|uniref:AP2/ERF and B3 domain transcription factor n=1 Tax=Medicago truncatula TaxID=3880 RepID=G7IB22_MEDTR|nr:AP2/ERF and B3 domain-containing transcription factor At1g51120 [Medicago truncatula]AES63108.1 AP2/ERF and B3 domain transcription factor [Medicago truncatula]RHN82804.1 putative transcription factor RAV family [Medicago truncatula]